MPENNIPLISFYKGWDVYQQHLTNAITPLTPDQLALRAAPHLRSIDMIAAHIIGARARWFHQLLGEGGPEIAQLGQWDRSTMPARTSAELVSGLETTWQLIQNALVRWTPADLERTFQEEWGGKEYTFTLQWVLWHVIEHDVHHGGEISLTLGMHGLAAPDI
jgi:uncharacterized damage-inducible protein DinB